MNTGIPSTYDIMRLGVQSQGNFLNNQTAQQGNLLDRLSAYERNFVNHDLGLKQDRTNRYGIDAQRTVGLAGADAQRYGADRSYDANVFSSLSNLAGNRYGADRAVQGQLGSAAIGAQAQLVPAFLQQQRFQSLAPHVLGAIGSLGSGMGGQ